MGKELVITVYELENELKERIIDQILYEVHGATYGYGVTWEVNEVD